MQKKFETFMFTWTGRVIMYLGFFCATITMGIDIIRQRPMEWGWLQVCGVLFFMLVMVYGGAVQEFLTTIKMIFDEK